MVGSQHHWQAPLAIKATLDHLLICCESVLLIMIMPLSAKIKQLVLFSWT